MATKRPNTEKYNTDHKHWISKYNDSNIKNYSHLVNENGDFNLPTITLENIDEAVQLEFNKRFTIRGKEMPLINGDTETSSLEYDYPELFNQDKQFLITPLFMYERIESKKIIRTNPSYKPVIYAIPKKKAQGIVIEEIITEGPINWELTYEFTFITDFKESCNEMEKQFNYYFRNKRNVIAYNNERFGIGPASNGPILQLTVINKEENSEKKMYVLSGSFIVWAYTRDLSNIQKRERPNSYTIDIVVRVDKEGQLKTIDSSSNRVNIEREEIYTKELKRDS